MRNKAYTKWCAILQPLIKRIEGVHKKNNIRNIILLLIIYSSNLYSQTLPDQFNISNYLEVNKDSLRIYFNCTGTIVSSNCAEYYREGVVDRRYVNFSGKFIDYFITGQKAFEATMQNNYLVGPATYYYKNGNVKSKGSYLADNKIGIWNYYYKNGQLHKVINFKDNTPEIREYYKSHGKQKVVNGNGKYQGEFYAKKACDPFEIKGKLVEGKPEGKWGLYNPYSTTAFAYEFFEEGSFIEGKSLDYNGVYYYTDHQKIILEGYCPNENVQLDENNLLCPGDYGFFWPEYNGGSLVDRYYPKLNDSLFLLTKTKDIENQWLIVGLKVTGDGELKSVNISSSVDDKKIENAVYQILISMNNFQATKANGNYEDCDLYFSILFRQNKSIIPKLYILKNR